MHKKTILIVDDEFKIRILLRDFLENSDFKVIEAEDGQIALDIFNAQNNNIDLILLDVMLPKYNGWTVCKEIRKTSDVPIIMLTAKSEDFDELHGFELGADDYVKKPVKPSILIARIKAIFRKNNNEYNKKIYKHNNIEIDDSSHIVRVKDTEISLSPKEYALLIILFENKGNVLSREQLLDKVWGYDYFGGLRTVDTHVNRLRLKLGDSGKIITTIRSFGYKLED